MPLLSTPYPHVMNSIAGPDAPKYTFLIFYSSVVNGQMWCPDCLDVEGVVKAAFDGQSKPKAIVHWVGSKPEWREPKNEARNHWRVDNVPTILRLVDVSAEVGDHRQAEESRQCRGRNRLDWWRARSWTTTDSQPSSTPSRTIAQHVLWLVRCCAHEICISDTPRPQTQSIDTSRFSNAVKHVPLNSLQPISHPSCDIPVLTCSTRLQLQADTRKHVSSGGIKGSVQEKVRGLSCCYARTALKQHHLRPVQMSLCKACNRLLPSLKVDAESLRRLPACRRRYATETTTLSERPLKVAIIGAGPSGFYAASRILSSVPSNSPAGRSLEVHMYERLPTPYGLVRYGVAPDHPAVKNCQSKFDDLAFDPRFKYCGNVSVGTQPSSSTSDSIRPPNSLSTYSYPHALHVPLNSLLPHYTSILYTYGASLSNSLSSVRGSSSSFSPLRNVFPALAFVGWYNGHPAFKDLPIDFEGVEDVAIVGVGNVALDVARILLSSREQLEHTDIPTGVLDKLSENRIRRVSIVGRRGAAQASFTTKELREIINLPDTRFPGVFREHIQEARDYTPGDPVRNRQYDLLEKYNNMHIQPISGRGKELEIEFMKSPKEFKPPAPRFRYIGVREQRKIDTNPLRPYAEGVRVASVKWGLNQLVYPPRYSEGFQGERKGVTARATGKEVETKVEMVIESVGYRSEGLGVGELGWSLPFDDKKGILRNVEGRLVDIEGQIVPGMYAAGWVAKGPVGVITSTLNIANAAADTLLADHFSSKAIDHPAASPLPTFPERGVPAEVAAGMRTKKVVDLESWNKIDTAEVERAKVGGRGKPREKFTSVEAMLEVL